MKVSNHSLNVDGEFLADFNVIARFKFGGGGRLVVPHPPPVNSDVHGGFAAVNRGADGVPLLIPSLHARTRYWTGHRELYNQTALAFTAHGAGQHRD